MDDQQELRAISNRAINEGRADEFIRLLHAEEDYVSYNSNNLLTYQHMSEQWLMNFRDNLFKNIDDERRIESIPYDGRPVLCVGSGPSITDKQLHLLKNRKEVFVICTNKIAERLLKYRTPDLVVVLHGTDEIRPHFQGERVVKALNDGMVIALPTAAEPTVVAEVQRTPNIWWYNAAIPNMQNIDSMMKLMSRDLPTFDTGGNVGLCSIIIAREILGAKVIGFMGMETCLDLKAVKTDLMASMCDIVYMPERQQLFAVPPSFKDYAISMGTFMQGNKDCQFINLTPVGVPFLSAHSWGIENMDLSSFLKEQKCYIR